MTVTAIPETTINVVLLNYQYYISLDVDSSHTFLYVFFASGNT